MFTKEELGLFRTFIHENLGISIPVTKDYLVESKLRRALTLTGLRTPLDLISQADLPTLRAIVQSVTTNHTFFFREPDHFPVLVQDLRARKISSPLIWCAAASSGEEPYTIAMSCYEAGFSRFRILASDIDREMLATMNEGRYPDPRMQQVPPPLLSRYFFDEGLSSGSRWYRVKSELRDRVIIKELNLLRLHRLERPVHAIFLRNVLIYFDRQTQVHVIDQVARNLGPGGLLFLGHSESLLVLPTETPLVQVGASIYRKKEEPSP